MSKGDQKNRFEEYFTIHDYLENLSVLRPLPRVWVWYFQHGLFWNLRFQLTCISVSELYWSFLLAPFKFWSCFYGALPVFVESFHICLNFGFCQIVLVYSILKQSDTSMPLSPFLFNKLVFIISLETSKLQKYKICPS